MPLVWRLVELVEDSVILWPLCRQIVRRGNGVGIETCSPKPSTSWRTFWSSAWNDISLARSCTCGRCSSDGNKKFTSRFADLTSEKNDRIVEPSRTRTIKIVNSFTRRSSIWCARTQIRRAASSLTLWLLRWSFLIGTLQLLVWKLTVRAFSI